MKYRLFSVVLFICCSVSIFAQDIDLYPDNFRIDYTELNQADTQFMLNLLSAEEFDRADSVINYVYQQILIQYKDNPTFINSLIEAQRAWIIFRDKHIESILPGVNKGMLWGSMFNQTFYLESAEFTWDRVIQLYRWLKPEGTHGSFGIYQEYLADD